MSRFVYAIRSEAGPVKIGVSRCPSDRLKSLQPLGAYLVNSTDTHELNEYAVEAAAHDLLKQYRRRGEWFEVIDEVAIEAIRRAIDMVADGWSRPQKASTTQTVGLLISSAMSRRIDDWRAQQPGRIPSKSEAVRTLVDKALEAEDG